MDWPTASIINTIILGLLALVFKIFQYLSSKKISNSNKHPIQPTKFNFDVKVSEFDQKFENLEGKIGDIRNLLNRNYDQLWDELKDLRPKNNER